MWKTYLNEQKIAKQQTADYEEMKAGFYIKHVDPQFNHNIDIHEASKRIEFVAFCTTQAKIRSLTDRRFTKRWAYKNEIYFAFLIILPINLHLAYTCFTIAVIINLAERMSKENLSLLECFLIDEDTSNFINMVFIMFSGTIYKLLFILTMVIWASLNVAEFGCHVTGGKNQSQIDQLKSMRSVFVYFKVHRVFLVQLKNHIEVFIALSSPFGWIMFGMCAPLLPVIYT